MVELQSFCRGQIGLKLVRISACRTPANFFVANNHVLASISAMLENTLVGTSFTFVQGVNCVLGTSFSFVQGVNCVVGTSFSFVWGVDYA